MRGDDPTDGIADGSAETRGGEGRAGEGRAGGFDAANALRSAIIFERASLGSQIDLVDLSSPSSTSLPRAEKLKRRH